MRGKIKETEKKFDYNMEDKININTIVELQLEVEPIKPDTPSQIGILIKDAINEAFVKSGLEKEVSNEKPRVIFQQNLPTAEQLNLLVAVIQLAISTDPMLITRLKSFLELLFASVKLKRAAPDKINFKLSIGDKKIEAKNLSLKDTIEFISKEYEVIIKPIKGQNKG